MAKLKAHGYELDRREYPAQRVAVMSDGHIMRDYGSGWKLWKKLKPGIDAKDYAKRIRAQYDAHPPVFHAYVKALMDATDIKHRSFLHEAVRLMPTDPDGVWSEFNDFWYGNEVDLDDCVKLCRLYQEAIRESELARETAAAPIAV